MYNSVSDKSQDIPNVNVSEAVNARSNMPLNIKKCDMCHASFKKKNTLEKHMMLKHNKTNCSQIKKIGEGKFVLRLTSYQSKKQRQKYWDCKWKEKECLIFYDKVEQYIINNSEYVEDIKNSEYEDKNKESEVVDVKDNLQI